MPRTQQVWRGIDLVEPAVPLPRAKYVTLMGRWQRWPTLSGSGTSGARVDPRREIATALEDDVVTHILMAIKDSLGVNRCVESIVAEASRHSHGSANLFVLLAMD